MVKNGKLLDLRFYISIRKIWATLYAFSFSDNSEIGVRFLSSEASIAFSFHLKQMTHRIMKAPAWKALERSSYSPPHPTYLKGSNALLNINIVAVQLEYLGKRILSPIF